MILHGHKMSSNTFITIFLSLTPFFGLQVVDGFSSGPPASIFPAVCTTMSPFGHGASLFPSNTPIPYSISVEPMEYTPGEPLQGRWLILGLKYVVTEKILKLTNSNLCVIWARIRREGTGLEKPGVNHH